MTRCGIIIAMVSMLICGCVTTEGDQSSSVSADDAALYNIQLGIRYLQQGKLDLAKEKLDRALEQAPNNPDAHTAMALLLLRFGDNEGANKEYRTAVRLDPDDSNTLNNYGVFLCQQDRFEEAEKHFMRAANNPLYRTPEAAYTNAGVCARRAGDNVQAENYLRRALSINPGFPDALSQMAELSYKAGNYLPARAFVQRYLAAAPATPQILWVGVRTEENLGNQGAADEYAEQLKNQFPASAETRQLLEFQRDAG